MTFIIICPDLYFNPTDSLKISSSPILDFTKCAGVTLLGDENYGLECCMLSGFLKISVTGRIL